MPATGLAADLDVNYIEVAFENSLATQASSWQTQAAEGLPVLLRSEKSESLDNRRLWSSAGSSLDSDTRVGARTRLHSPSQTVKAITARPAACQKVKILNFEMLAESMQICKALNLKV